MAYRGHFIVAHHPVSLSELLIFRQLSAWSLAYEDEAGRVPERGSRPGGWHVLEIRYGLSDTDGRLGEMVAATRAPVMIVSFSEGELVTIRGLGPGPRAEPWTVRRTAGEPLDAAAAAAAADAVAGWSEAAGGRADRAGLTALLATEPGAAEDFVFRLVDAAGLSTRVEPAPSPHEVSTWDDPVKLEKSLATLPPGRYRALDCGEHRDCYALVRRSPEGDYLLEYREQRPEVAFRAGAPSLDQVITAMQAWARGEVLWRDDFEWTEVPPPAR